jgi:hypothetical protein
VTFNNAADEPVAHPTQRPMPEKPQPREVIERPRWFDIDKPTVWRPLAVSNDDVPALVEFLAELHHSEQTSVLCKHIADAKARALDEVSRRTGHASRLRMCPSVRSFCQKSGPALGSMLASSFGSKARQPNPRSPKLLVLGADSDSQQRETLCKSKFEPGLRRD